MGVGDLEQLRHPADPVRSSTGATIIALGLGNLVAIDLMQRVFSARTPGGAQKACSRQAAGILMLCIPLSFVALAAVSIVGTRRRTDRSSTPSPLQYAPVWLAIIVISGLLAATSTTVSGILLATAAVLVRNVLRIDADAPVMTPRVLRRATRWATRADGRAGGRGRTSGAPDRHSADTVLRPCCWPAWWCRSFSACTGRGARPPRAGAAIVVGIGVRLTFFVLTPTIYGVDNTLFYVANEWVTTARRRLEHPAGRGRVAHRLSGGRRIHLAPGRTGRGGRTRGASRHRPVLTSAQP